MSTIIDDMIGICLVTFTTMSPFIYIFFTKGGIDMSIDIVFLFIVWIFIGVIGGLIFLLEGLYLIVRLLTRKGRLELKSWYHNEWVEIDGDGMLYRFDYHGFPIAMKWSERKLRESMRKIHEQWSKSPKA